METHDEPIMPDRVYTPEQLAQIVRELSECCDNLLCIFEDLYHPTDSRIVAIKQNMNKLYDLLK